jgi:hypothetical protein
MGVGVGVGVGGGGGAGTRGIELETAIREIAALPNIPSRHFCDKFINFE